MKSKRFVYSLIILISTFYLLSLSWFRWGNLIVDTFSDSWVAYKITQGKVLYKDVYYLFGPLGPYSLAFLYRIFGININWAIPLGIFILTFSVVFLYRISRFFLNREFSTLIVLNFLFVFAFGIYSYTSIFNFILPYNLASTLFIMFLLSALYFSIKFILKDDKKSLLFWVVSVYFAFLSRLEMSLITWVIFVSFYLLHGYKKQKLIIFRYALLPFLLASLSYLIFLCANNAFLGFNDSVIGSLSFAGRSKWELFISGFNNIPQNLGLVIKIFIYQLIATSVLYIVCLSLFFIFKRFKLNTSPILIYSLLGLISIMVATSSLNFMLYLHQYRLLPLLLASTVIICLFTLDQQRNFDKKKTFSLLILSSISLVLITRIVLKVSPHRYGFYLAVPGLVCYYVFFVEFIPLFWRGVIKVNIDIKKYYSLSLLVCFILLSIPFVKSNHLVYSRKNLLALTSRGKVRSFPDIKTKRFWEAAGYINKNTPRDSKMVVFPEGIALNFFTARDNPLKYFNFVPTLVQKIGEEEIIHQLNIYPIDYVVIVHRYTLEHGYPVFGKHYGQKIRFWIDENYTLLKLIGPSPFSSKEFGIAIFKRK